MGCYVRRGSLFLPTFLEVRQRRMKAIKRQSAMLVPPIASMSIVLRLRSPHSFVFSRRGVALAVVFYAAAKAKKPPASAAL